MGRAWQRDSARAPQLWSGYKKTAGLPWACCDGRTGAIQTFKLKSLKCPGVLCCLLQNGQQAGGGEARRKSSCCKDKETGKLKVHYDESSMRFASRWRRKCVQWCQPCLELQLQTQELNPCLSGLQWNINILCMIHSATFLFDSVRFLSHYETRDGYYSMLSYVRVSFLACL